MFMRSIHPAVGANVVCYDEYMKSNFCADPGEDKKLTFRFEQSLKKGVTPHTVAFFRKIIYDHYEKHRRPFAWRMTEDPYRILVSEIMLQQTQTERVREKYEQFITAFPSFRALARAPLQKVLSVWQGMGYNRRAIALKELADVVVREYKGKLPSTHDELRKLPGVGPYTASAIAAFAFNQPVLLIETNIRTVFIHLFFQDRDEVTDREILPLIELTLDVANPRIWYNALMDYGAMLKKYHQNPGRRSAHYKRQTPFEGSDRQMRGALLKVIIEHPGISEQKIIQMVDAPRERLKQNLNKLREEGFIKRQGRRLTVA